MRFFRIARGVKKPDLFGNGYRFGSCIDTFVRRGDPLEIVDNHRRVQTLIARIPNGEADDKLLAAGHGYGGYEPARSTSVVLLWVIHGPFTVKPGANELVRT